jgi:predicted DNA-binding protein YlxM (UPF0122 family)
MPLKYNWEEIQAYYDEGYSLRECQEKFGFSNTAYAKAKKANRFQLRPQQEACCLMHQNGKHKQNWSEEARDKLRASAKSRKLGGTRNSKKFKYNGITLDSTYEVRVAQVLDRAGIQWQRPKTTFIWVSDDNGEHRYKPDFYLLEQGIYLDPKNDYLAQLDRRKIDLVMQQNGITVRIISLETIEKWEAEGFSLN